MTTNVAKPGNRTRFTLRYSDAVGGQAEQAELPMRLLVIGALTGRPAALPLARRRPTAITAGDFDDRMTEQDICINATVKNELSPDGEGPKELSVSLKIRSLKDFTPDRIIEQVPELHKLARLREALRALRAPLMDRAQLRERLEALLRDDAWCAAIAGTADLDRRGVS